MELPRATVTMSKTTASHYSSLAHGEVMCRCSCLSYALSNNSTVLLYTQGQKGTEMKGTAQVCVILKREEKKSQVCVLHFCDVSSVSHTRNSHCRCSVGSLESSHATVRFILDVSPRTLKQLAAEAPTRTRPCTLRVPGPALHNTQG